MAVTPKAIATLCSLLLAALAAASGDPPPPTPTAAPVPLMPGLTLVSVLQFPEGDRESVVAVEAVSATGTYYTWQFVEHQDGERVREGSFRRFVRAEDLAAATRLHTLYRSDDQAEYPGYTAFTISSAVYEALQAGAEVPFSVMEWAHSGAQDGGLGSALIGSLLPGSLRLRGTLSRISSAPEPFPLLQNGRRVSVPAIRLQGQFAHRDHRMTATYWVMADGSHPLLLRMIHDDHVWQVVRVDLPDATPAGMSDGGESAGPAAGTEYGPSGADGMARTLAAECRVELPGVYFAFGTADLHPASRRTLSEIGPVLASHPDWMLTVEGHTDDIGGAAYNARLSQARADAVREWLILQQGVSAQRITATGLGARRPLEANDSLEGRARNRRVELIRDCSD